MTLIHLIEDVFNAMVDRFTKDGSTYGSNACFRPHEVQTIHDIFETYCQEAGTEKCMSLSSHFKVDQRLHSWGTDHL